MKRSHRTLPPASRAVRLARILYASIPIAIATVVLVGSFI